MAKRPSRERLPKQFGTDPENSRIVRQRAERMNRPIDMQLDHLLTVGIKHDPEVLGNESHWELLRESAHVGTQPHMAEPRRANRHSDKAEEGVA